MPGGPSQSEIKRKRLETLASRLEASKRKGHPSQQKPAQQSASKRQKTSGQQARKQPSQSSPFSKQGDKPQHRASPAAVEQLQATPPYDKLEGLVDAALPRRHKAEADQDGSFVHSLLERMALGNLKAASSRGALGLRQQDRSLLLDNPAGKLKKARPCGDAARQLLSGTKLRELGLQHPVPGQCTHTMLWPLHLLWRQYVTDVLSASGASEKTAHQLDLHGSCMRVVQHPDAQLAGLQGVLVKAGEHNVHVVTQDDRYAVIPRVPGCELHCRVGSNHVVSLIG